MKNRKLTAWLIGLASVLVLLASGAAMALRITRFHEIHPRHVFAFQDVPVSVTEFTYAGKPVKVARETEGEAVFLRVAYGDDELRIRATLPENQNLPEGVRSTDWMKILRFVPVEHESVERTLERMQKGEVQDRLVLVTRTPPPGADPQTWGAVWRKGWMFDFHEFRPEGGFASHRLGFPSNRRGEPAKEGELAENTWEMQAALQLMPKGRGPNYNPKSDALSAVGWTLPLAGISVLGIVAAFVVGTPRRQPEPA